MVEFHLDSRRPGLTGRDVSPFQQKAFCLDLARRGFRACLSAILPQSFFSAFAFAGAAGLEPGAGSFTSAFSQSGFKAALRIARLRNSAEAPPTVKPGDTLGVLKRSLLPQATRSSRWETGRPAGLKSHLDPEVGPFLSDGVKILTACCLIVCSAHLNAEESSSDKLLDRIISHPGSYSQVCDVMSAPSDIPYQLFQITDFSGASLSKANQALVDGNRDGLIQAIRSRLLAIDFSRKAVTPAADPKPEENFDGDAYGCDPKALSPMILTLIQQLHGIEALPELLVVEQKLVDGIARAKDNAKVAPPVVAGWQVAEEGGDYDEKESEAKRDRRVNLFQARIAQRDLVMTMAVLLRGKAYKPYLATTLEAAYVKGLKAKAKEKGFDKIKVAAESPKEVDGMDVVVDPITNIIRPDYFSVKLPYTRESRDEIRAVAERWIAEHP